MSYGVFDEAMGVNHREAIDYREQLGQFEEPDYDRDRAGSFMGEDDRANRPDVHGDAEVPSRMPLRNLGRSRSDSSAGIGAGSGGGLLDPGITQTLKASPASANMDVDLGRGLASERRYNEMAPLFMGGQGQASRLSGDSDADAELDRAQDRRDDYMLNARWANQKGVNLGGQLEERRRNRPRGFWATKLGRGMSWMGRKIKGLFGRGRR